MIYKFIKTLIDHLPRHAEEEGLCYSISRENLIDNLIQKHNLEKSVSENTISLCESLLRTLSLLDPDKLAKGTWCFVSFPAQLMALSVLTAMSDPESHFFEPKFWNTHDVGNNKKEEQRKVLNYIENKRSDEHVQKSASPIRFIHVSWALIKYDGQVLFHQREDVKKRNDDKSGDYSLVGGRLNQSDMHGFGNRPEDRLPALQSPDFKCKDKAFKQALKREMLDETGLVHEEHYTFEEKTVLSPYRQVEGAENNHALTEYYINIFPIQLTEDGFFCLRKKIKEEQRLLWVTIDEVIKGKTKSRGALYINALFDHFKNNEENLRKFIDSFDESFIQAYAINDDTDSITLPEKHTEYLAIGKTGKENEAKKLQLTELQRSLLLGLALHLRGFLDKPKKGVILQPFGWVEVKESCALKKDLISLSETLETKPIIIESHKDHRFRLSVLPEIIFFGDSHFSCSVKKDDLSINNQILINITRKKIETDLGIATKKDVPVQVTKKIAHIFVRNRNIPDIDKSGTRDNYRKSSLHIEAKKMGIRQLVKSDEILCCSVDIEPRV